MWFVGPSEWGACQSKHGFATPDYIVLGLHIRAIELLDFRFRKWSTGRIFGAHRLQCTPTKTNESAAEPNVKVPLGGPERLCTSAHLQGKSSANDIK